MITGFWEAQKRPPALGSGGLFIIRRGVNQFYLLWICQIQKTTVRIDKSVSLASSLGKLLGKLPCGCFVVIGAVVLPVAVLVFPLDFDDGHDLISCLVMLEVLVSALPRHLL